MSSAMVPQPIWAAITKYHDRWLISNRNVFLIVLEAESPRSKHQQVWGSLLIDGLLMTVTSWCKSEEFLRSVLLKDTDPITKALPS